LGDLSSTWLRCSPLRKGRPAVPPRPRRLRPRPPSRPRTSDRTTPSRWTRKHPSRACTRLSARQA